LHRRTLSPQSTQDDDVNFLLRALAHGSTGTPKKCQSGRIVGGGPRDCTPSVQEFSQAIHASSVAGRQRSSAHILFAIPATTHFAREIEVRAVVIYPGGLAGHPRRHILADQQVGVAPTQ
jgi:hypothetical protein